MKYSSKIKLIDNILADLRRLEISNSYGNVYALQENIKFFEAFKSWRSYLKWFLFDRPRINGKALLELSDFDLGHSKWELVLQTQLKEIEQWSRPDLLKPVRESLLDEIKNSQNKNCLLLVSTGCGHMEIERQVISALRNEGSSQRILFVGIDNSDASLDSAISNLEKLYIPITRADKINPDLLEYLLNDHSSQFKVALVRENALKIDEMFSTGSIDILYHTKFKHHLPIASKELFDLKAMSVAKTIIENDNLNRALFMLVSSLSNWYKPILANGAVFSSLRDPLKADLENHSDAWKVKFYMFDYIKIYQRK